MNRTTATAVFGAAGLVAAGLVALPVAVSVVELIDPGCEARTARDLRALRDVVRSGPVRPTHVTDHSDCDSGGDPWLGFETPDGTSAKTIVTQYVSAGWKRYPAVPAALGAVDGETAVAVTKAAGDRQMLLILYTQQSSGRVTGEMAFTS
ncbi:hypothetical protein Pth03_50780 [Planotetraspora thailandica]|uniref:Uncharacterized protein n=1 Tax=Planotetraspora thailandica TaxID=487172 RepID=A0A8J3XXI6_9ACTN|nr:hypothetical protein [Planotetraspora thailandica]GII56689.1 hypothetical protein Pth03_50780 [Planotetraspora thailandica]